MNSSFFLNVEAHELSHQLQEAVSQVLINCQENSLFTARCYLDSGCMKNQLL